MRFPQHLEPLQQPVTREHLRALYIRALGSTAAATTIHELSGGTMNTVYHITFHNHPPIIVRIAPSETNPHVFHHEHHLLRREYAIQPFLAPIGQLLPTLYLADFTQQIVARDVLIQAAIAGDLWRDVQHTLTLHEATALWHHFGHIAHQIHSVHHHAFGAPDATSLVQRWSDTLLMDFQNIRHDLEAWGLPSQLIQQAIAYLVQQRTIVDSIQTPCLLHGDLWLNNLLIQRAGTDTHIVGVLDAGFAQWGDPAADWTLMRMSLAPPLGSEAFWDGYGQIPHDANSTLRNTIYRVRSLGWSILELHRRQHPDCAQVWHTLAKSIANLHEAS